MKPNTIFKIAILMIGLAISLFLAIGGFNLYWRFNVPTPGVLAERALAPQLPPGHQLDNLGESLLVQGLVDWIFWFAVMYFIYFLVKKLTRKSKELH